MTVAPYCPDEQCVEDECSPQDPCCISVCACARAEEDCRWAGPNGDTVEGADGTVRDVWYCGEHKKEWLK